MRARGAETVPFRGVLLGRLARFLSRPLPRVAEFVRERFPFVRESAPPWALLAAPINRTRLALVSACGVRMLGEPPLPSGPRPIPGTAAVASLAVEPFDGDRRGAARDPNVVFPLDRLRELAQAGAIGGATPRHYGIEDLVRDLGILRHEVGAFLSNSLAQDGAGAAILVGCGAAGAQTACLLARALERSGIPTVAVVGIARATLCVRPPRAVVVPGRSWSPFGAPGNRALQRDILLYALRRLEAAQAPGDVVRFTRRLGPTGARGPDE